MDERWTYGHDDPKEAVESYRTDIAAKSDLERQENKEKTGVFLGTYATNPVSGKKVPIFIADYVLTGYGTGAIMAVPAHDTRDYEFAKAFGLPITEVVSGGNVEEEAWTEDGALINSSNDKGLNLNGLNKAEAIAAAIEWLEKDGSGREKCSTNCAIGYSPASVIGASPSPSSTTRTVCPRPAGIHAAGRAARGGRLQARFL